MREGRISNIWPNIASGPKRNPPSKITSWWLERKIVHWYLHKFLLLFSLGKRSSVSIPSATNWTLEDLSTCNLSVNSTSRKTREINFAIATGSLLYFTYHDPQAQWRRRGDSDEDGAGKRKRRWFFIIYSGTISKYLKSAFPWYPSSWRTNNDRLVIRKMMLLILALLVCTSSLYKAVLRKASTLVTHQGTRCWCRS